MRRTSMLTRRFVLSPGAALLLIVGFVATLIVGSAQSASASCWSPPAKSPNAFVGTVIHTELDGRKATVETEDGRTVTVVGTPSPQANSVSSIDRHYEAGATYEFHPTNAGDPYEDNACTRTHRLIGEDIPAVLQGGTTSGPAANSSNDSGRPEGTITGASDGFPWVSTVAIGTVLALALAGVGAALLWRRKASQAQPA